MWVLGVGEQEAKMNNGAKAARLSHTLGRVTHSRCRLAPLGQGDDGTYGMGSQQ
jgi:hypothetical protein